MDTYLSWALNALFHELFDPSSSATDASSSSSTSLFPLLMGPALTTGTSTASSAVDSAPSVGASAPPIGETATPTVLGAIQSAAASTGLSPALLRAVATVESGLNPGAVSAAGAMGLMQLMPQTAASLGVNPGNVVQNVQGGAEYLKTLLTQFGQNLSLALAAYNAGPGAVEQYGTVPPYSQTQQYVSDVLAVYRQLSLPSTPASPS